MDRLGRHYLEEKLGMENEIQTQGQTGRENNRWGHQGTTKTITRGNWGYILKGDEVTCINRPQGTIQTQDKVKIIMGDKKMMFLAGFCGKNMFACPTHTQFSFAL